MANKLNRIDSSLLEEVGEKLDKDKLTTKTGLELMVRMMLSMCNSNNSIIDYIDEQNGRVAKNQITIAEIQKDIASLQKKNIIRWVVENKLKSVLIFIGVFVVNASINWQGIRQPLIKAILHTIGIDIPIEVIP